MTSVSVLPEDTPARMPHVPKYYWLQQILRQQIAQWEVGQTLPSESELCRTYAVSRTTVRKAIDELVHEGLVHRLQGKGTYVAPSKMKMRFVQRRMGFFEEMAAQGFRVQTKVLKKGPVTPTQQVAARLGLEPQDKVMRIERLRCIDAEPILWSETFLSFQRFQGLLDEDLDHESLYAVLAAKYGVQIKTGTSWVDAGLATKADAAWLQIPVGAALLIVSALVYDQNAQPIDYGMARQRSDRTQIEISMVPTD